MTTRVERIAALTPRQALDLVQYMTASLAEQRIDGRDLSDEEQVEALKAVFQEAGYSVNLPASLETDERAAGQAARQFLLLLAELGDKTLLAELDEWLADPPAAATAAIPLVLAAPILLTACIVLLQTGFVIERKGIRIEKPTLTGKNLQEIVSGLFSVINPLAAAQRSGGTG